MSSLALPNNAPPSSISSGDRLGLTLFLAAALHAILVLGIAFDDEDKASITPPPSLEIILVQNQNQDRPDKADYLAQTSQEGGGESDERDRPSNPFTALEPTPIEGMAPMPMEAGAPEAQQQSSSLVLTKIYSDHDVNQSEEAPDTESDLPKKDQLSELDLQIAKMTAELNQAKKAYAKRPKKLQLTASTHEYVAAGYMARWVEKIERIGNLNLPDEAHRNKLHGQLMLEVELKHDGSLIEVKLINSSNHQVLDDAARRIVYLATPFEAFPPKLRAEADHIEIVRTWEFSQSGLVTR